MIQVFMCRALDLLRVKAHDREYWEQGLETHDREYCEQGLETHDREYCEQGLIDGNIGIFRRGEREGGSPTCSSCMISCKKGS